MSQSESHNVQLAYAERRRRQTPAFARACRAGLRKATAKAHRPYWKGKP